MALAVESAADRPPVGAGLTSGASGVAVAALLPGVAQWAEGRRWRGVALGAVEVGGWWLLIDARGTRNRERDAYRDLAWAEARRWEGERIDPGFEYYEDLLGWTRSGAFDADPQTEGIQPERDPESYNGRQWHLAAAIFLEGRVDAGPDDPGWARALAWYEERAWGEEFVWDWAGKDDVRRDFARRVDRADAAARRASIALGLVVANHVLSAIEAFAAHRLATPPLELQVGADRHGVPYLHLRVPWSP